MLKQISLTGGCKYIDNFLDEGLPILAAAALLTIFACI